MPSRRRARSTRFWLALSLLLGAGCSRTYNPSSEEQDWIVDFEISTSFDSAMVFTAKNGPVDIDLSSGDIQLLDPTVFTYAGFGEGYPEKIRNRVTTDHRWFLNQRGELVSVADGSSRPLQLGGQSVRPVVFVDERRFISLTDSSQFQLIELDPDRVLWTAPALDMNNPESYHAAFDKQVPLSIASPTRNTLYYEVDDKHYAFDVESRRVTRVEGMGKNDRLLNFSTEGDLMVFKKASTQELFLMSVATGETTPLPCCTSIHYLSSRTDLAIGGEKGAIGLIGFSVTNPDERLWRAEIPPMAKFHVSPDGKLLLGADESQNQLEWADIDRNHGPGEWHQRPFEITPGKREFPTFVGDAFSGLVIWDFGLQAELFSLADPGGAQIEPRVFDLRPLIYE